VKRDIRMTDRETIIKGLEWWVKHQEGEVLPLAYSAVVETLKVLKEQDELLHKKQNDIDRLCNEISEWKHKFHDTPKEQEAIKPKIDAFGHPYCPKCKVLVYQTWSFCPHCGQAVKWE